MTMCFQVITVKAAFKNAGKSINGEIVGGQWHRSTPSLIQSRSKPKWCDEYALQACGMDRGLLARIESQQNRSPIRGAIRIRGDK